MKGNTPTTFTGRYNLTKREEAARRRVYGEGDHRRISRGRGIQQ